MTIKLLRKSRHKFFEFVDDSVTRTVCVDGWVNTICCPSFCHPRLEHGWQPLYDDKHLEVFESADNYVVICPTCFGYKSPRGIFRNTGLFHMNLELDKSGLSQFLYNYTII